MKIYIGLLSALITLFHANRIIATDTPQPHRWYDNAQEVQIYKGDILVHDLNWYHVDGNWYENGQFSPDEMTKEKGYKYVAIGTR
jgi:hypothetical protein